MTFALVHIPRRERVSTMTCVVIRTVGLGLGGTVTRGRIVQPLASDSPLPTMVFGGSGKWQQSYWGEKASFPCPFPHPQRLDLPGWSVSIWCLDWAGPPRDATLWLSDSSMDWPWLESSAGWASSSSNHLKSRQPPVLYINTGYIHRQVPRPRTDKNPLHSCMGEALSSNVLTHQEK